VVLLPLPRFNALLIAAPRARLKEGIQEIKRLDQPTSASAHAVAFPLKIGQSAFQSSDVAREAAARLQESGDLAEAALKRLLEEQKQAKAKHSEAEAAIDPAVERTRHAREWGRLQQERRSLDEDEERIRALLADEASIRAAACTHYPTRCPAAGTSWQRSPPSA